VTTSSPAAGRLVSLAAGTVLDVDPAETVSVAAGAGFGGAGIWFDPAAWTPGLARRVAQRLDATGIVALDVEPVLLSGDGDPGDALIEAAAGLGARFVLLGNRTLDDGAAVRRVTELCERAAPAGITIAIEFLPPFAVGTLDAAVALAQKVGAPNVGVLVDTLHLARSGHSPDDLRRVPPALLPYLQLADAPAELVGEWREEALHGRLLPGEGALPLAEVLAAVPDVPVSMELRSRRLMSDYPDPLDRARAVLHSVEPLLR